MGEASPTGRTDRAGVDVVLLSGDAASALATELAVGPYAPDQGSSRGYDRAACPWLAVASARGSVVGVALARRRAIPDGAACELLAVEISDGADEEYVKHRLLAAVRPLFRRDQWVS